MGCTTVDDVASPTRAIVAKPPPTASWPLRAWAGTFSCLPFFLAVSAVRRAAHTGHKADGNTAGGVPSPGRRNPGIVPWTSVPCKYLRKTQHRTQPYLRRIRPEVRLNS